MAGEKNKTQVYFDGTQKDSSCIELNTFKWGMYDYNK
jgi:hypothetical protein